MHERNYSLLLSVLGLSAAFYTSEASACAWSRIDETITSNPAEGVRWSGVNAQCAGPAVVRMWNESVDFNNWYAWEYARQNWNSHSNETGVTIVFSESRSLAQLITFDSDAGLADDEWNGKTDYTDWFTGEGGCTVLNSAVSYFNRAHINAKQYTFGQIYGIAVHELGHALGLHHDDSICSAMVSNRATRQDACGVFDVTPLDVTCLEASYAADTY
jgi:hypothetical protein